MIISELIQELTKIHNSVGDCECVGFSLEILSGFPIDDVRYNQETRTVEVCFSSFPE